jgi:NAD(P)-dependent dehydrogenase (short-subunit alcohol dehydrogenase family)
MMKTVVITGASKGLGKALTIAIAKKGYNLAICARGEERLLEVKQIAEEWGSSVLAVKADVTNQRDIETFISMTESRFGQIDVLINNAAVLGPSPMPLLLDYSENDFMNVLKANTLSPFMVTKRVLPGMLQRNEGSIINVTSEAGQTGYAGWGAYGISKFAMEGLTETWADELSETGIRINMIDPGSMDTDMHALAAPDSDEELAKPEDIVGAFLYLVSDHSRHITGKRFEAQNFQLEEGDLS